MQLILTGDEERDMEVLLYVNKGFQITFDSVIIGAKRRHSSHHKAALRQAYSAWAAPIRRWNSHDSNALSSPYRRQFVVSVD